MTNLQPPPTDFCDRAQELILMQLDMEPLPELDQVFIGQHLASCVSCAGYQRTMGNLVGSLRDLDEVPVPAGLLDRIMDGIAESDDGVAESDRRQTTILAPRGGWRKTVPVAAAALLLAVAAPFVLNSLSPQPQSGPTVAYHASGPSVESPQRSASPAAGPGSSADTADGTAQEKTEFPSGNTLKAGDTTRKETQTRPPVIRPLPTMIANAGDGSHSSTPGSVRVNGAQAYDGRSSSSAANVATSRPAAIQVDSTQLADASDALGLNAQDAFSSEQEGDLYYDPMTTLVGF